MSAVAPPVPTGRPSWTARMLAPVVFAYVAAVTGAVHFGAPGFFEQDGYFHARLAQLFPERALDRTFPWHQASTWKDRFCDKEFLYHALMAPFCTDEADPGRGARVFTWLLGLAVAAALYLILRAQAVPWPAAYVLLLAGMGGPFLIRLAMTRSHVLSIVLALVGMHFLLRGRWKALAVLGFVYAWSYTFPLVLAMIAVPYAIGKWLGGGGLDWKCPCAALAGVVLGLAIHPFAPYTLDMFLTLLEILRTGAQGRSAAPLELGSEFLPYSTRAFVQAYPLWIAIACGATLLGWLGLARAKPETLGAWMVTLCFLALAFVYSRFAEYGVPLAALAAGLLARDALAGAGGVTALLERHRRAVVCTAAGMLLLLAAGNLYTVQHFLAAAGSATKAPRFTKAAEWMRSNLEPGETVVNLWWDDFPELFYDGYRQHYLWGIDPTFVRLAKPGGEEKARLLEEMRTGRVPLDGAILRQAFGARVLVLGTRVLDQYPPERRLNVREAYSDPDAMVFWLGEEVRGPSP